MSEMLDVSGSKPGENRFDPLPKGDYHAALVEVKNMTTASGGKGATLKLQVISGPYTGRSLRTFLNITHPKSPEAQNIGQNLLREWCLAVDANPSRLPLSLDPLMRKPVLASVIVTPARSHNGKDYGPGNNIVSIKKRNGEAAAAALGGAPAAQQTSMLTTETAAPTTNKLPWE